MGVISLAGSEESLKGVVAGDGKAGEVGEELSANVEEDGEEVEGGNAKDYIDLGDRGLGLQVVEGAILGQLEWAAVLANCY